MGLEISNNKKLWNIKSLKMKIIILNILFIFQLTIGLLGLCWVTTYLNGFFFLIRWWVSSWNGIDNGWHWIKEQWKLSRLRCKIFTDFCCAAVMLFVNVRTENWIFFRSIVICHVFHFLFSPFLLGFNIQNKHQLLIFCRMILKCWPLYSCRVLCANRFQPNLVIPLWCKA